MDHNDRYVGLAVADQFTKSKAACETATKVDTTENCEEPHCYDFSHEPTTASSFCLCLFSKFDGEDHGSC